MKNGDDIPFTCFYTSNISLPRQVLNQAPFSSAFNSYGWEDIELGYRLSVQGLRIVYNQDAKAKHFHPMNMTSFLKRQRSVGELTREVRPFANIGLCVLVLSGLALFSSEAVKCYFSFPFWVKMSALATAIVFTFTIHNRAALAADDRVSSGRTLIALVSLALWFTVAASGRWIGFSG